MVIVNDHEIADATNALGMHEITDATNALRIHEIANATNAFGMHYIFGPTCWKMQLRRGIYHVGKSCNIFFPFLQRTICVRKE